MPTSPNLGLIHLQPQQQQPDLAINPDFDQIDGAITGLLTVTITSADVTLTTAQAARCRFIRIVGALTGNRNLIVPATVTKEWVVSHEGTNNFTVTVKTPSGTGVAFVQSRVGAVFADGINVVPAGGVAGSSGGIYDQGIFSPGLPASGAVLHSFVAVRDFRIPAGLAGSKMKIPVVSTTDAVISFRKNGSQFGTVTAPTGSATATFAAASDTDFSATADDFFEVIAPSPQDATLANFTLVVLIIRL